MSAFDTLANALAGKVDAPNSGAMNQRGNQGAMTQLQSGRDEMLRKMRVLGLTTMPEGGEAELEARYAQHLRQFGAAASDLRK